MTVALATAMATEKELPAPPFPPAPAGAMPESIGLDDRVREFEASLIRWALHVTHGNKSRAAALLRIKRSTLGDRIVRCGLEAPEGGRASIEAAG
jgi:DNA-binding NtrC family response regulator